MLRFHCKLSGGEATERHAAGDTAGWPVAMRPQEAESIRILTPSPSDVCPKQSNELHVPLSTPLHSLTSCSRLVCFCWLPSVYSIDTHWWRGTSKHASEKRTGWIHRSKWMESQALEQACPTAAGGPHASFKRLLATSLTCLPWILYLMRVSLIPPAR